MIRAGIVILAATLCWGAHAQCPSAPPAFYATAGAQAYATSGDFSLDSDGILVRDYGTDYDNLGKFRNPLFVANYAQSLYLDWVRGACVDDGLKAAFLKQANWLERSAVWQDGMAVWKYPFRNNHFNLGAGWISGITQSVVAGVMIRALSITGEARFERATNAALVPYQRTATDGGVMSRDGQVLWIEEAPHPDESYRILNGHITALQGIADVNALAPDPKLQAVVNSGVAAVARDIDKFDAGFTSFYSLSSPTGTIEKAPLHDYNVQHVSQLLWLYDITKNPLFLNYALKFQSYEQNEILFDADTSIAPQTNGPDKADGQYYSAYWSSSTFPTWISARWPDKRTLVGVGIDALEGDHTPKDFAISISEDGTLWRRIFEARNNDKKHFYVRFAPQESVAVRLEVEHASGPILALQAMMPVFPNREASSISNYCNYRTSIVDGRIRYNFDLATDKDAARKMEVLCPGWMILKAGFNGNLVLAGDAKAGAQFEIEDSDDLQRWEKVGAVPVSHTPTALSEPRKWKTYVRVKFGGPDQVTTINTIKMVPNVVTSIDPTASIDLRPFR